jgi:energy-coupling factor transport system permease protein
MKRRVPVVYNEAASVVHRRDPRAKLLVFAAMMLYFYVAPTWEWMAAMVAVGVALAAVAKVPPKWLGALLLLQLPNTLGILAFPAIERVAAGGAAFGGNFDFGLKLALSWTGALFVTASLFTTMELTEIIDGLRSLGVPELLCFTLEYVLLLFYVSVSDLFRVWDGMKAKGLPVESRNPLTVARNAPTLAVPMLVTVLRRSNTMMSVLTMRGYTFSRDGRELRHEFDFDAGDALLVGGAVALLLTAVAVDLRVLTVPLLPSGAGA